MTDGEKIELMKLAKWCLLDTYYESQAKAARQEGMHAK